MKKICSLIMALILMLAFSACSDTSGDGSSLQQSGASDSASAEMSGTAEDISSPDETGQKSLVVYFSWSGNTENVAKSVRELTGSDTFEILPVIPYSDDYNTVLDLAHEQQRNNDRPEISGSIENFEQYDVIYVGFPNWWGDMPMIMYTFFDTYDMSGKTVALFCTSGGSGLSNTVNEVKALEPDAEVTEGLHIRDNESDNPESAVGEWLNEIGISD